MSRKKVIMLAVSLVLMVSLLAGAVSAQGEGIGKALGKMGEIFSSMTGVVSLDKILGGDKVALAYAYFIIWLIFFGATYYGVGFVFPGKPRIQAVVAIGFSLFVLMIPPSTMTGIAKSYSMAFTLIIWLVPVAVAFVLAWKVESKAMKAILYFGLLFLLSQADNAVVNYFNPSFKESGFYEFFYIFYIVAFFGFIWSLITMWGPFRGAGDKLSGKAGDLADKGVDYLTKDQKKEDKKLEKEEKGLEEAEEKEEKTERREIRRGLRKVTKKTKKESGQILEDLRAAEKYIDEFGQDKKAREEVIIALNKIPPTEHEINSQVKKLEDLDQQLERMETLFVQTLNNELNDFKKRRRITINPRVKKAAEDKIKEEFSLARNKFRAEQGIDNLLKQVEGYNKEFESTITGCASGLKTGRIDLAKDYLRKAIELEQNVNKIFDTLFKYENYILALTKKQIQDIKFNEKTVKKAGKSKKIISKKIISSIDVKF